MNVGGVIDMSVPKKVINSMDWEYQITDTKWDTYPKTISSLINREYSKQRDMNPNVQQYAPIFYQLSNGNQFRIDLCNLLQFNLQNNSVAIIRPKKESKTERLDYNKCPECLFKISPNVQVCNICNTRLQIQNNNNSNIPSKLMQDNEKNKSDSPSPKPVKPAQVEPPKENAIPKIEPFILCPSCDTKNKKDFNFCVGCSFCLKDYKPQNNENEDDNKDANTDVEMVNPGENNGNETEDDCGVILEGQPGASDVIQSAMSDDNNDGANDSDVEIMDVPGAEGEVDGNMIELN